VLLSGNLNQLEAFVEYRSYGPQQGLTAGSGKHAAECKLASMLLNVSWQPLTVNTPNRLPRDTARASSAQAA